MNHEKVEAGKLYHERCDSCEETQPALKFYLDFEDPLKVIERHTKCGEYVWDFSIALHGYHGVVRDLTPIVRGCSSHSNYHVHWWEYLYPKRKKVPKSKGVLDNEEQADRAYHEARVSIIDRAFQRREEWRPGKH